MAALQVQSQHHPTKREEQLLDSLHKMLEVNNYQLDGGPTSHSLKELLSAKAVEMEATTNTSITALITLTTKPNDIMDSFEKLVKFCAECPSTRRTEVAQIMYPVLIHLCIYLLSQEYRDHAKLLNDRYFGSFDSAQQADLSELFSYSSTQELLSSELVNKFREKKYCIRMSDKAFHLLMQFIQVLPTPFLLTVLERYLEIEVYGNAPVVMTDTSKPEPKKTITFTKPRLAKLDENRLRARMKNTLTPLVPPSSDFPAKVTSSVHMDNMTEYKDALAGAEMVDPTTPSVAMFCVHSTENNVHCASLSSTSKQYVCGFADSSIHLWSQLPEGADHFTDMARPHPIGLPAGGHRALAGHSSSGGYRTLTGHSGPVYSTCFSDMGTFLISGSEDSTVRLWDLQRHANVVGYHGHTYPIWDVSFSPIGVHFASASMDQTARLWTCDLTYPLRVFAGHTSSVNVVRFHPNGQYVATGSHDRTCRLWDIQSGQCVRLMPGCKSSVTSIAFSPNGKQLVSGGADGVTRVWDLDGGSLMKEYPPPVRAACKGAVSALTFSVDSTLMASSSHSNCVNVYNMRRCGQSPHNTSEDVLLSLTVSPKTCSTLHLQFTHRNCVVGIAKIENPSTTYSDLEPLHEQNSNDRF